MSLRHWLFRRRHGGLSCHDIGVIHDQLARLEYVQFRPPIVEIHVSSKRMTANGLKVFGYPIRRRDELGLNEGAIIVDCRDVIPFDFEATP